MTLRASSLLLLLAACIPGPGPRCVDGYQEPVSGACVHANTEAELAYASRVLALSGAQRALVSVHLYPSRKQVTALYPVGLDSCLAGFNDEGEIHTTPEALAHELVHSDIEERTQGRFVGASHAADTGWLETDDARKHWLEQETFGLLPYESGGCDE